ncbi:hypothetical protein BC827DRAFT_626594 [Russula dissimulans]|jgi:hypothetical protein|nr:hypothetical protein BC827DRAFT_626594 [Russula dissimulans]
MQLATRRAHPPVPVVYSAHLPVCNVRQLRRYHGFVDLVQSPLGIRFSAWHTPYLFTYCQLTMSRRLCGQVPQFSPGTFVRFSCSCTSIRLARLSITVLHTLHSCNSPLHQFSPFLSRLPVQPLSEHHRSSGLYRPRVPHSRSVWALSSSLGRRSAD